MFSRFSMLAHIISTNCKVQVMLMRMSLILQVSGHKYLDKLKSSPDGGARGNHKRQPQKAVTKIM